MTYLTILNTAAIIYILATNQKKYYLKFETERTNYRKTLIGYTLELWRRSSPHSATRTHYISLLFRNRKKAVMIDEADYMIERLTEQGRKQSLIAVFSWLKTWGEVKTFQKYYARVDSEVVNSLVTAFAANHDINHKN